MTDKSEVGAAVPRAPRLDTSCDNDHGLTCRQQYPTARSSWCEGCLDTLVDAARALREPLEPALVEALAAYAHEAWSGWMRHLFSKCDFGPPAKYRDRAVSRVIPAEWVERWLWQVRTPYAELREDERESDRKEARRMLAIVRASRAGAEAP